MLADRLRTLLMDDALRIRLAKAAHDRAHSLFTVDRFVANTTDLYNALLSQHYKTSAAAATAHS